MVRSPALRDRIAAGILETAASVLAERESASMADIAEAAGVGRATLYRYFPNRDALLRGLLELAAEDLAGRLAGAELDSVPVREGIARLARGFVTAGSKFAVLAKVRDKTDKADLDRRLAVPVRTLIERGIADGTLRPDIPADVQFQLFTGLLQQTLRMVAERRLGIEQGAAAIITVFLDGTGT